MCLGRTNSSKSYILFKGIRLRKMFITGKGILAFALGIVIVVVVTAV